MLEIGSPASISCAISTPHGSVNGLWRPSIADHAAHNSYSAALLLPGYDGLISGPAELYCQLALRLQQHTSVFQFGYRSADSVADSLADVHYILRALGRQGIERVALIGWNIGAALAIAAGSQSDLVTGVACLAPDSSTSEFISAVSPRRLLLIHGSADTVIPPSASYRLHAFAGEPSEFILYPGEAHDFTICREAVLEKLTNWTSHLLRRPFRPARTRRGASLQTPSDTRQRNPILV